MTYAKQLIAIFAQGRLSCSSFSKDFTQLSIALYDIKEFSMHAWVFMVKCFTFQSICGCDYRDFYRIDNPISMMETLIRLEFFL